MPRIPAVLDGCSTTERVTALLYLGWTHEEIAAATNVSKGTVQNRRTELKGGNLQPPPEVFAVVRSRERELHRVARNSGTPPEAIGTEVADRFSTIADLDALDIGPNDEISYEELIAFATLIAGQLAEVKPREVVKRLAPLAILVDYPSGLSESVLDSSRQLQMGSRERGGDAPELTPPTDEALHQVGQSTSRPFDSSTDVLKDNVEEQDPDLWKAGSRNYEQQFDTPRLNDRAARTSIEPSTTKEYDRLFTTPEECERSGRNFDEETGMFRVDWSDYDEDLENASRYRQENRW